MYSYNLLILHLPCGHFLFFSSLILSLSSGFKKWVFELCSVSYTYWIKKNVLLQQKK